jgi:hypothetical protein
MKPALTAYSGGCHYLAQIGFGEITMSIIARRLAIVTLAMTVFAISFAALATHNPRMTPCVAGVGDGPMQRCIPIF